MYFLCVFFYLDSNLWSELDINSYSVCCYFYLTSELHTKKHNHNKLEATVKQYCVKLAAIAQTEYGEIYHTHIEKHIYLDRENVPLTNFVLDVLTLGDMRKFQNLFPFLTLSLTLATTTWNNTISGMQSLVHQWILGYTFLFKINLDWTLVVNRNNTVTNQVWPVCSRWGNWDSTEIDLLSDLSSTSW